MNLIREAAQFLKQARKSLRRDANTREPLTILRVEWEGGIVRCDWLMRSANVAGGSLSEHQALVRQSEQSLQDALDLSELIFDSFPAVMQAQLKMFRADRSHCLTLMMSGSVHRMESALQSASLKAMPLALQARKAGLQFELADGVLIGPLSG